MKLGGSLRRTRGRRSGGRTGAGRKGSARGGLRSLGMGALGLAILGWAVGYLVSTRVVFPAPPPPTGLVAVPDVRGTGLPSGREMLAGAGLALGVVDSIRHPSVAAGLILGQAPLPGQLALPGTEVSVTRSLGPQMREVPDVVQVDVDRARVVLETSGFVVTVDSVEAEAPRGRVLETVPAAADTVALPAEIQLVVSVGPPLVPMPLLLGLDEVDALATLDSLGLVAGEVEEVFRFGRDRGIVVEQEPPADTPMERGAAVRLAVGRRGR